MTRIQLGDVLSPENLGAVLADRVPDAWREAGLLVRPADGVTTWEFFEVWPLAKRGAVVTALLKEGRWPALVAATVPKHIEWKTVRAAVAAGRLPNKSGRRRPITIDTRAAHAAQLALARALNPIVRKTLCPVACGFVPGLSLEAVQLKALTTSKGVSRGEGASATQLSFSAGFTADIHDFFGQLDHDYLDTQVSLLLPRVEDDVLALLKSLARVRPLGHPGSTKGIAQGLVLSPMLANIYLNSLDKALQRALAPLGCIAFRYADDFLVLAPNEATAARAFDVLRTALPRCGGLRLRDDKTRFFNLKNRQNPARWIGVEWWIDRHGEVSAAVPRDRIEAKAAELLTSLGNGELLVEYLDEVLDAYRRSFADVIGEGAAQKAAGAVQNLLVPLLVKVRPPADDLHHVRHLLAPLGGTDPKGPRGNPSRADSAGGLTHAPLSKLLAQAPLRSVRICTDAEVRDDGDGADDESDERSASSRGTPPTWGGNGTGYRANRPSPSSSAPGRGGGRGRDDGRVEEDQETGTAPGRRMATIGGWPHRSTTPSPLCSPLVAEGVPETPRQPPAPPHHHGRDGHDKDHSTPTADVTQALLVSVQPRRPRGRLFVRDDAGRERSLTYVVTGATTDEVVALAGHEYAVRNLRGPARQVVFRLTQATIANTVHRRDDIRSPAILTAWARLLHAIDALPAGVAVESVNHAGVCVSWRRPNGGGA